MPSLKAKLVVNCGGMFSGKSTELQRQGERHLLAGHKVVFIKPKMDDRYSKDEIVTHEGRKVKAVNTSLSGIMTNVTLDADVILIDEVQFYNGSVIENIKYLLKLGKVIYCSGLDMDYKGDSFEVTAQLLAVADDVNKFKAVCSNCGDDGYVTVKLTDSKYRVELGSQDIYKPVCRQCFNKIEGEIQ